MRTNALAAVLPGLAFAFAALAGCQMRTPGPSGAAGLAQADKDSIQKNEAAYVQAANAKDWAALSNIYAEDAVVLPPDTKAVEGRAAIQEFFGGFPAFSDFTLNQSEIGGCGDLAYARGTFSLTTTGTPGGPQEGKYIEVWRKQPGGSWKISRDIWNENETAPAAAAEKK